jgi:RNA-directed DNA polymerase
LSDLNARTPPGADVIQRTDLKPAFNSNLLEHVLRRENLQAAWKRVRANKGAAGIDGMTIDEFPAWAKSGHWSRVTNELATGRYTPSPVKRVEIDKPEGGKRQLGIPTLCDRVIRLGQNMHMATNLAIDPNLLNEALLVGGLATKKDTVNQALTEYVQRRKQQEVTKLFGTLPCDEDYDYKKGRK